MSEPDHNPNREIKARLLKGDSDPEFTAWLINDFTLKKDFPESLDAIEAIENAPAPLQYTFEEVREKIIHALGVDRFKANGFSVKPISCLFHDDEHPSANLHREKGLYCFVCGETFTWKRLAGALGIPWRIDPATDPAPRTSTGIVGMSRETRRVFIREGLTNLARALDVLIHLERGGETMTLKEFSACLSPYLSAKCIRVAFDQLHGKNLPESGEGEFLTFFSPSLFFSTEEESKRVKNSPHRKTSKPEGRPAATVRAPTLAEITDAARVTPRVYYAMDPETIKNAADYRAEAIADQFKRKPGTYPLSQTKEWLGTSAHTVRRYARRRGIQVTPQIKLTELTPEDVLALPENYIEFRKLVKQKKLSTRVFLTDENNYIYPYTKNGAKFAAYRGGGKLYRAERLASHYGPAQGKDSNRSPCGSIPR